MRKPRDFDVELQTLERKAKQLKERRVRQLGELVSATGADTLDMERLAGALLDAVSMKDVTTREGWRQRGATFFRAGSTASRPPARAEPKGGAARPGRRAAVWGGGASVSAGGGGGSQRGGGWGLGGG